MTTLERLQTELESLTMRLPFDALLDLARKASPVPTQTTPRKAVTVVRQRIKEISAILDRIELKRLEAMDKNELLKEAAAVAKSEKIIDRALTSGVMNAFDTMNEGAFSPDDDEEFKRFALAEVRNLF